MSLTQGGSGIPLMPALYEFLVSSDVTKIQIDEKTIPDPNIREIVNLVTYYYH